MPFDRLINRLDRIPQLYIAPHVPVRPVIPWGDIANNFGNQLVGAAQYLSPQYRAQNSLARAQIAMAPQEMALRQAQLSGQLSLYPQQQALQQKQIDFQNASIDARQKFIMGSHPQNPLDPHPQMNPDGSIETQKQAEDRANAALRNQKTASEMNNSTELDVQANAARDLYLRQHAQLPSNPEQSGDLSNVPSLFPPDLPPIDGNN